MTYTELKKILDKEGIGCLPHKVMVFHSVGFLDHTIPIPKEQTKYLYIQDAPIYLFPLKERIESILKLNDIKAKVEVKEEEQLLTIEIEK